MTEEWRPVVGFEGYYEVSDLGRVCSVRTNHGNPRRRMRKPSLTHDGYERLELSRPGCKAKKHVSHMVLEAFVGPRPEGHQACHGPVGLRGNRLSNLRWDTVRANYDDIVNAGSRKGERHGMVSISEEVARQIKIAASDASRLARDIADEFSTTVHIVRNIRNSKSWAWL